MQTDCLVSCVNIVLGTCRIASLEILTSFRRWEKPEQHLDINIMNMVCSKRFLVIFTFENLVVSAPEHKLLLTISAARRLDDMAGQKERLTLQIDAVHHVQQEVCQF